MKYHLEESEIDMAAQRKDAARYRFIRDHECRVFRFWRGSHVGDFLCQTNEGPAHYGNTMDEAVDAAMKEE